MARKKHLRCFCTELLFLGLCGCQIYQTWGGGQGSDHTKLFTTNTLLTPAAFVTWLYVHITSKQTTSMWLGINLIFSVESWGSPGQALCA